MTVDGSGIAAGTYELVLESFDNLSVPKSALKTDRINIHISGSDIVPVPEPVIEPEPVLEPELVSEPELVQERGLEIIRARFEDVL